LTGKIPEGIRKGQKEWMQWYHLGGHHPWLAVGHETFCGGCKGRKENQDIIIVSTGIE